MPERASTMDCHTSSLSWPIEQMMPAPVTAIRMLGSGFFISRRCGQIKPPSRDFYSIDRARSFEPERPAECCLELDADGNLVARFNGSQDLAAIDAGQKSPLLQYEAARKLRHR